MAIELIAHTEVGVSGTTAITFSSIPSTYDDLMLFTSIRTDRAGQTNDNINIRFNGDTATNYSRVQLTSTNGAFASAGGANATSITTIQSPGAASLANAFGSAWIYIPNYKTGSYNKQVIVDGTAENNTTTTQFMGIFAGLYRSVTAISSLTLFPNTGPNIVQHSQATLYGIKKA